jgi:cyclopropane fatty-acyl-phospholipid synthase-like methyltransferase
MDVSPSMLKEAQDNCASFGIGNVDFHLSNGDFDHKQRARKYDFVNSYIVLQHIPVQRGYAIIDNLLGLVADHGIAMLHVSLRRKLSPARAAIYQIKHRIPLARFAFNFLQQRGFHAPLMQMNEYDLVRVLEIFSRHGMSDIMMTLENHRGVETARLLARKNNNRPSDN